MALLSTTEDEDIQQLFYRLEDEKEYLDPWLELDYLPKVSYRFDEKREDWYEWLLKNCVTLSSPQVHMNWLLNVDGGMGLGKSSFCLGFCKDVTERMNEAYKDTPGFRKIPFTVQHNVLVSGSEFLNCLVSLVKYRVLHEDVTSEAQSVLEMIEETEAFDDIEPHDYPPGSVILIEEAQSALSVAASAARMETEEVLKVIRSLQINVVMNEPFFDDVKQFLFDLCNFRLYIHRKTDEGLPLIWMWTRIRRNYQVKFVKPSKVYYKGGIFEVKKKANLDKDDPPVKFVGKLADPKIWKEYMDFVKPRYQQLKIVQSAQRVSSVGKSRKHQLGSEIKLDRSGWNTDSGKNEV